ncbi:MAG: hypothetical protein M3Q10_19035, partial [Chloroflexota bacterium]|nr:hypothetical protein [Chloroflexota bacterium]
MADIVPTPVIPLAAAASAVPRTLDEARALARERFKTRLEGGEKIGECACHDDEAEAAAPGEPAESVAGVRFRDSGRTYYFRAEAGLTAGDWVVVETSRGREAGRVVIAPHQVILNRLEGELKPILRRLGEEDVARMEELKGLAAGAVRTFGARLRARNLPLKPISAEYAFDGTSLLLNYAVPDRERVADHVMRDLSRELADVFGCRVDLRQVGPRDEARLLGGLGRCGRTLCCSSWLPVFPEISMNMAKTQDLPLNPSKVSGVCGRLLCCLSYENEQYRQMKAVMPRLGQPIETPAGPGMVVSMQVLKELVTVRLAADNTDAVFSSADLGLGGRKAPAPARAVAPPIEDPDRGVPALADGDDLATDDAPGAEED